MTKSEHEVRPEGIVREGSGFFGMGIAPKVLEILDRIKFREPTPIQSKVIPMALAGKDVIGIAQTGTGKTHAFAVPMVQRLASSDGIGLVLAPTRELAMQIDGAMRIMAHPFGMHTACLIGGASMQPQLDALRRRPRIIIGTPGRFIDHMERRNIMMAKASILVVDEADRMFDMGFAPQVERILSKVPRERQTMLFSATMPPEIVRMINTYMKLPVHVEVAPSGTTAANITQALYIVRREHKLRLLAKILDQYHGSVLLFMRTKYSAMKITRSIRDMGHKVEEIHSDKSMAQRREALEGFKSGRYRILVATDIASRGIDVTRIELVINYDLPDDIGSYVHRIGRTGRAGCKGYAITFAMPDQRADVRNIEQLIRMQLPVVKHPDMQAEEFYQPPPVFHGARRSMGSRRPFRPRLPRR